MEAGLFWDFDSCFEYSYRGYRIFNKKTVPFLKKHVKPVINQFHRRIKSV